LLELVGGWRGRVYLVIAVATLTFRMRAQLALCDGFIACSATFLKAALWSLAWPFYYATDFVLFKPYSWS
jgi:hypothetical protein